MHHTAFKGGRAWHLSQITPFLSLGCCNLTKYKRKTTLHHSLTLTTLLAFWVAAKTKFPFKLSRLIMIPPPTSKAAETSILAVGGEYNDTDWWARGSQRNVQYAVKCCNMKKRRFFIGGPPRVTRFGARCRISEGKALRRYENVQHGLCGVTSRYFPRDSIKATPDSLQTERHDLIDKCFSLFRLWLPSLSLPSTSSLLVPAFVVWHRDPCLLNGDLMPKVWSAQLSMGLTEKPAVCLSALCEASQTLKDTHCIEISGTWYLCGHGTCLQRGQTASGTTRNWAVEYSHNNWLTDCFWEGKITISN